MPLTKTEAVGTDYELQTTFQYDNLPDIDESLDPESSIGVRVTMTTQSQVQVIDFDGEHKKGVCYQSDNDAQLRKVTSYDYDNQGRLLRQFNFDYELDTEGLDPKATYSTSVEYLYGRWGEVCEEAYHDGRILLKAYDPFTLQLNTQLIRRDDDADPSTITAKLAENISFYDLFGNKLKEQLLDINGQIYSDVLSSYDGFGRKATMTTPTNAKATVDAYDAFDRITQVTLDNGQNVLLSYQDFTKSNNAITSVDTRDPDTQTPYNLGKQVYNGLTQLTQRTVASRTTSFLYQKSKKRPDAILTPKHSNSQGLTFDFVPELKMQASAVNDSKDSISCVYTKSSEAGIIPPIGSLATTENATAKYAYTYSRQGFVNKEVITDKSTNNEVTKTVTNTLLGQLLQVEVKDGEEVLTSCQYTYDEFGRLKSTIQDGFTSTTTYDDFGRVERCETTIDGCTNKQTITANYDEFGREWQRQIDIINIEQNDESSSENAVPQINIQNTYNTLNQLTCRETSVSEIILKEVYLYDAMNRLQSYTAECSDTQRLPQDEYGNAIVSQAFDFDMFDNVISVTSTFHDNSRNVATYTYTDAAQRQVSSIQNSHKDYVASVSLEYDADGNVLKDKPNVAYAYSDFGRLTSVSRDTENIDYLYDSLNRIFSTKTQDGALANRFYVNNRLAVETSQAAKRTLISHQGMPVAEVNGDQKQFLATNSQNSVISVLDLVNANALPQAMTYTPHGFRHLNGVKSGFNGEIVEDLSGFYLLGHGTRAYAPTLALFLSADSYSPFNAGGINPYMYCNGDPINNSDPSGHFSSGADLGLNIFSLIVDLFALGAAIYTGGASLAIGAAIMGVTSDTLGIAADSMAIKDAKSGDTSRQDTIQNLGFASGIFGLASMGVDAGMSGHSINNVVKKRPKSGAAKDPGKQTFRKFIDDGTQIGDMLLLSNGLGRTSPLFRSMLLPMEA
ncbi:hypothetical protein AT251_22070 [Enterovibrio nigricans]|nr:RHS repeat-associated core domain-containing protein [Enterovibrio nigricans]PKF49003.1 hypothetical protein AT251_22070 [Enterovibrio nigricans]